MKKVIAGMILAFGLSSAAHAASIRYFQDAKFEKNVELGVKASSAAPFDATLKFNNATNNNQTILRSTNSVGAVFYLPESTGTAGQVMKIDTSGQLGWTTAITEGGNATFQHINATSIHVSTAQVDGVITAGNVISAGPIAGTSLAVSSVSATTVITTNDLVASDAIVGNSLNVSSAQVSGVVTANDVVAADAIVGNSISVSTAQVTGVITGGNIITTGPGSFGGISASSATIAGVANIGGDMTINQNNKIILDNDAGADTYMSNVSADDTLRFFRNGTEYMRFD